MRISAPSFQSAMPSASPVLGRAVAHQKPDEVRFSGKLNGVQKSLTVDLAGQLVEMGYREYGNPNSSNVIVCVHGLTRNGQDFDDLAQYLADKQHCRVLCPDIVGRGESNWLAKPGKSPLEIWRDVGVTNTRFALKHLGAALTNPLSYPREFFRLAEAYRGEVMNDANVSHYNFKTYEQQMDAFLKHPDLKLGGKPVTWIGTSMGGMIGLRMAAKKDTPIQRLVLNDIGPEIGVDGLRDLSAMMKSTDTPTYPSIEAVEEDLRDRYQGFGELNDEEWTKVAEATVRYDERAENYRMNFDPKIIDPLRWYKLMDQLIPNFARMPVDAWMGIMAGLISQWHSWESIKAPTLVLRGADSTILSADTLTKMMRTRRDIDVLEYPGVGHAPTLLNEEQKADVERWLSRNQ